MWALLAAGVLTVLSIALVVWKRPRFPEWRKPSVEVVADLDALVSRTLAFRFNGVTHLIPPMTFERFLQATTAFAEIENFRKQKALSSDELIDAYTKMFSIMSPTITRAHVESMSHPQVGALFNLVIEVVMGKAQVEAEKKRAQSEE